MGQPYVGEIRMFGGNFPPAGWEFCDGQEMPISENETLFQLLGTTYGGNGETTFALPNLQGRIPLHQGTSPVSGTTYTLAQAGGVGSVTLTTQQLPVHNHPALASTATASSSSTQGNVPAHLPTAGVQAAYGSLSPFVAIDPSTVSPVGGSQPHDNYQPYTVVSFIISLFGIYPSQT